MIQETVIDESLNHLLAHFKGRVVVQPPATAADLAELEELAGPLPRDMTIFYATCNGIRVHLADSAVDSHVCCLHEIENVLRGRPNPAAVVGLILVRGDPNGSADWVVLNRGPAYGCVVRWNPWMKGATLIASSFGRYLQNWVEYLTLCFDHHARLRLDRPRIRFDAAYTLPRDREATLLRTREDIAAWLHELDLVSPNGDDFE